MIYLVGVLCLLLIKLQDINFIFDYLVPIYSVIVLLLVTGILPVFTASSPGERKLYQLKKKQKQQPAAVVESRHWKDCYEGKWMMCERNADEMAATDKWLAWAGQGYVQRTVALRLKGKQTLKVQDRSTYHYKREFIGPTGKPVNPFEYASPIKIGTSRETAEPQVQPFQNKDVYFRAWWDEENKVLFEEQGPLNGAEDKSTGIASTILYRRRIEQGTTPEEDRFVTEWEGTRISDGVKCYLTTVHQRIPSD